MMKVKDLMTGEVLTCGPQDSLAAAARIMWDHEFGSVPVVDGENRAVGVITDRDIAMAAYLQGKPLHETVVATAMSKEVHVCRPEDNISAAERTMRERQVRRLPVVDARNRVVGLLSLNDLARAGALDRGKVPLDEVGETLAAICRPPLPAPRPPAVPQVRREAAPRRGRPIAS
jgi:CBS domain-containing protein